MGPHVQKPLRVGILTCQIERGSRTLLASVSEKRSALRKARQRAGPEARGMGRGPSCWRVSQFRQCFVLTLSPQKLPCNKTVSSFQGNQKPPLFFKVGVRVSSSHHPWAYRGVCA